MIIKYKDSIIGVWDSKIKNTSRYKPQEMRCQFDKNTNQVVLRTMGLFNVATYSIEELEGMLKYLKSKNKEALK